MAETAYIVFKQTEAGDWTPLLNAMAVQAVTADAAIEAARTTPGTFVAVLARGFRPRTHYTGPRDAISPTVLREIQ